MELKASLSDASRGRQAFLSGVRPDPAQTVDEMIGCWALARWALA